MIREGRSTRSSSGRCRRSSRLSPRTSRSGGSARRSRGSRCSSTRSSTLDVDWTVGRVARDPARDRRRRGIYGAVWVALATIAFWIVDAIEVVNAFTYGGNFLSQYPIGIFARWLRGLVVFVIPLAFVAYFPALYVLDKEDRSGCPSACSTRRRSSPCSPSLAATACLAQRRPALPERRWLIRDRGDEVEKRFVVRAKAGRLRRERASRRRGATASRSRSSAARDRRLRRPERRRASRRRSRCSPASSSRARADVRVAGLDPPRQRIELARRIGVVFGQRSQLWWDLPLADSFDLLRHIYRVPDAPAPREPRPLRARRSTSAASSPRPCASSRSASGCAASSTAALLHDPEILFLDEPTIGLDVVAKAAVREFLGEVNRERGVTVLLTTHDIADIERLCARLLIIDHGRLIYDGGLDELKRRYGPERTLVVDLEEPAPPLDVPGARVSGSRARAVARVPAGRDERRRAHGRGRGAGAARRPRDRGDGHRGDRQADLRGARSSARDLTTTSAGGGAVDPFDASRGTELRERTRASSSGASVKTTISSRPPWSARSAALTSAAGRR